ncbi:type II toxin-antitoxin system VapB family antitoxin [Candidatus Albibeggiatoa sp. nov. NOAA]|uniref:type II toxin-antitoxin system VapB family antitoxin n=1 Tax=Candidatus Albibeggiatoa sp. nov. NOAA TaxID=3162724 RepID=UPI003300F251|nr:type II toxin-antitoxin system VapB family antitoxin [Thiotrichaceae bacterium]
MHTEIDDTLLQEAFALTNIHNQKELIHLALQEFVNKRKSLFKSQSNNPIAALLASDFIGCVDSDETTLSQNYKVEYTKALKDKYGYR